MLFYCSVYGCASTSRNKHRILFPFPLDGPRCNIWLQAIGRSDLAHLSVNDLHTDFRVCDLHFIFQDHRRKLTDDAIPNLHLPHNACNVNYEEVTKSTQTDIRKLISEGTQTDVRFKDLSEPGRYLETTDMACQTEILYCQDSQQWKIDNPLKRKLLITLAIDPKVAKSGENVTGQSSNSLNTYTVSNLKNARVLENQGSTSQGSNTEDVTCQPDIGSIVEEKASEKQTKTGQESQKAPPKKNSNKKANKELKSKATQKRKNCKRKTKETKKKIVEPPPEPVKEETSSESEDDDDKVEYDGYTATRLEEAIKLIQQQWKIHEKKYRKDKSNDDIETVDDPVEKLKIKQGRSYGNELKFLALNLFYSNPTAYRALRQHLNLPTEKTLRRIEVGISTKLTPTVLDLLKLIVSKMKEEEKICVVCANLLPLKAEVHKIANTDKSIGYHEINEVQGLAPASKTLVVLVKGLYSDWKQPLITCYLREHFDFTEVNLWLDNIIIALQEIGLKIVAFTTNEHPDLLSMAKERNIHAQRPFFYVNNQKVYYIFDIVHILNSMRNLLITNYFRYIDTDGSEQIASWFDIEKLFETDKTRPYKLAPKLTENHIRPNDLDKTRVQYSTQVFSKTVAAGIINCIDLKHLTSRAYGTVKLVELLNNIFDVLTSYDEKDLCRFKNPFTFKDYQMDVLEKMLNILPNFKIITKNYEDITANVETLRCFEITIRAFIILATDLKLLDYQYMCTKNLTLDPLDDFFESMRRKWGTKPSAVLFYAGFRNFFLENIIKKAESNDSCGLDKDLIEILLKDNSNRCIAVDDKGDAGTTKDFNPFFKYL